jgi:hypothetical protein
VIGRLRACASAAYASILHGSRATLVLASAMTLLAVFKVALPFEPLVMGWVYAFEAAAPPWLGLRYAQREVPRARADKVVTLLELDANAFEKDFGRRSPVERGCLAEAFDRLAERLAAQHPPGGFPVVAVDIDVTLDGSERPATQASVGDGGTHGSEKPPCLDQPDRIVGALKNLAKYATVIALAVERRTPGQRWARNRFVKSNCSAQFRPGTGGVYFASAAAFSRATLPIYETPAVLNWTRGRVLEDVKDRLLPPHLPPHYPSLGNLMAIAREAHDSGFANPGQVESLTGLCASIRSVSDGSLVDKILLDDVVLTGVPDVFGVSASEVSDRYQFTLLNFLAADVVLRAVPLNRIESLRTEPLMSSTIVLSLADGSTADRFVTPNNAQEFTPGAWLHAAAAVSFTSALTKASAGLKFAADLLAGVVFSALAASLVAASRAKALASAPLLHRGLQFALPLLIGALVVLLGACVSAWLLPRGVWFNPLYMALGMVLHAYIDASRPHADENHSDDRKSTSALNGHDGIVEVDEEVSLTDEALTEVDSSGKSQRPPSSQLGQLSSRLTDWVDVERKDEAATRSRWDLMLLHIWTVAYFVLVAAALFFVVSDFAIRNSLF